MKEFILFIILFANGLFNTFQNWRLRTLMSKTRDELNQDIDKVDSVTTKIGTDIKKTLDDLLKKEAAGQDFSAESLRLSKIGDALLAVDQTALDNDPGDGSTIVPPTV